MVDQDHLAAPFPVRMGGLLLTLLLPRAAGTGLLLRNADQDHLALAARFSRGPQQGLGDRLLVLAFGEVANGDTLRLGPAVNSRDVGSPIWPKAADEGILKPRCP